MPSRAKATAPKRARKPPTLARGGRKRFGTVRASGLQFEFVFRRRYPISEADLDTILRRIAETVRDNRRHYKWFFASVLLSVLGGLYQVTFTVADDKDDELTWEHQWVSTSVVRTMPELRSRFTRLVNVDVEKHLRGRPAFILRLRVVLLKNHGGNVS